MINLSQTSPIILSSKEEAFSEARRCVYLLMACYNGAAYMEEQLRSIQAQSFSEWVLLVRDDGSNDDTVKILQHWAAADPRIQLIEIDAGNLGPIGNFATLMRIAVERNAEYIFFADQDDVWHPDKLKTMLDGMAFLEEQYGATLPLLVHCDLAVVDAQMHLIATSFTDYMHLSPKTADLGRLLVQNQVTGCACLVNRAALELADPVPGEVLMHDWWLALLCAAAGKVGYVPVTLVNYRQHGANVVGAKAYWRRLAGLLSLKQWQFHIAVIRKGITQAGLVLERVNTRKEHVWPGARGQLDTYANILAIPAAARAGLLRQMRIYKSSRARGIMFQAIISLMRPFPHVD